MALAAYQRAAAVMANADADCGLDWGLLAAIGEVLTEHGQLDGRHLSASGVVQPALFGGAVRDQSGQRTADSDDGRVDGDTRGDRAVGPMSLPPATWASS